MSSPARFLKAHEQVRRLCHREPIADNIHWTAQFDSLSRIMRCGHMSVTLVEALGLVDLQAGRVYRCQVKGQWVELPVFGPDKYDLRPAMTSPTSCSIRGSNFLSPRRGSSFAPRLDHFPRRMCPPCPRLRTEYDL